MKIPVYLFTGFLEGGKTTIIQESLNDQNFNSGEKTLILLCEEGIEELDPSKFWGQNVTIEVIDSEDMITEEKLLSYTKGRKLDRIIIEYNGMWLLQTLYDNFPENWGIYQNMMFADANTFISYNNNMRQLVYDKVKDAEMVVLNRTSSNIDKEEIHKIIRGISRGAAIVYDYPDGHVEYDEIEDPLPFDLDADVIEIADEDYALWYRDLSEEMDKYNNKSVKFKAIVARDPRLDKRSAVIGRHVMTCCVDDIQFSGMIAVFKTECKLKSREWVTLNGTLKIESHKLYKTKGPVLYVESTDFAVKPSQEVATFY
jgi:G3E family GTPase